MCRNVKCWDRALRVILGVVLLVVTYVYLWPLMLAGWIVGVVGVILIISGLVGFCPAYWAFGCRGESGSCPGDKSGDKPDVMKK